MDSIRIFYETVSPAFASGTVIAFDGVFTRVDGETDAVVDGDTWTHTTSLGGDPLPPATALVVGWRTPSGGRSGRGRTFLGPMSVDTLEGNGTPEETTRATVLGAAEALVDANDGFGDGAVGVWSRQDQLLRDFTGASVRNVFASLRSRRD